MACLNLRNNLVTTLALVTSMASFAEDREAAQKLFWSLNISNTNQCAQQSQLATPSIYMFVDGYIPGRGSLNAAVQTSENLPRAVKSSWGQFHRATIGLTMKILNGLSTKELKTLSQSEINSWSQSCLNQNCGLDIEKNWNDFQNKAVKNSKAFCHEIIQPFPSMFATHMQKKEDLEKIALSYLEAEKYLRTCDTLPSVKDAPDALYKFSTGLDAKQMSFEYWESFKIYSSWAWRQSNYLEQVAPEYSQIFKSLTIEDAIVIIPEGCFSVKKPECGTDDLSESHLRTIGDNKLFRLTAKGMAADLRESAIISPTTWSEKSVEFDPETGKTRTVLTDPRASHTGEADNYRGFLLNIMDSRIRTSAIADSSLFFLQTLFNQRSPMALTFDFNQARSSMDSDNQDQHLELELMCAEVISMKEKDISFFAKEIDSTKGIFSNLNRINFPGHFPLDLVNKAFEAMDQILPTCNQLTRENVISPRKYTDKNKMKMGLWYQRLSSSSLEMSIVGAPLPPAQDSRDKKYLFSAGHGLCSNEFQCLRRMMESVADLYSVSLYANSIFGTGPARNNKITENFGIAVACGKYDPWYEAQHRRKKLLLDVASSLAQAVLPIPFYIELDPHRPEVMSFKERIESGQIKFAAEMSPTKYDLTTYLDFGPLTHTPCAISLGLGGQQAPSSKVYAFTGITGNVCSKERKSQVISASVGASGLTEKNVGGNEVCGSCTYQFVPIRNSAAYFDNVRYWGAGIRLFQGVLKFFSSKNGVDMPQSYVINADAVAETYKKYNGIPDECVWELHHGVRCMKNLCVSSAVANFEKLTGQKVKDASLYKLFENNNQGYGEKQVWMKLESCDGEVGVTVTCAENEAAQPFSKNRIQAYGNCRGVVK